METQKRLGIVIVGILVVCFISQANTIISVILADVSKEFPDASRTQLQLVMQFGKIGAIPMALCVGFLRRFFTVKSMSLTGILMVLVGGLLPIAIHGSIGILLVWAFIVGMGQGILASLLGVLVLQNFVGQMQNRMLGFKTTFAVGGAAVLLVIAGPIALTGWTNVFWIYALALPAFIVALICLPKDEKIVPEPKVKGAKKIGLVPFVGFVHAAILFCMYAAYVSFPLNISLYLDASGLGGPVETSLSMTTITVVGAALGIIFAPIIKKIRYFAPTFACVFGLLGMLSVILAKNIMMIYASSVLLGFFFGMATTFTGFFVFRFCTKEQIAPTMSVCVAAINLGVVLAPFIINPVSAAITGGQSAIGAFQTCVGLFAILIIVTIIYGIVLQKKYPHDVPIESAPGAVTAK